MKITQLIQSLQSVVDDYPDAEYELGFCSCCVFIIIKGTKVAALNVEEDTFEYLHPVLVDPVLKEAFDKHFKK